MIPTFWKHLTRITFYSAKIKNNRNIKAVEILLSSSKKIVKIFPERSIRVIK
jgi:indole-3-glycerol phosphate synthase